MTYRENAFDRTTVARIFAGIWKPIFDKAFDEACRDLARESGQ